MLTASRTLDTLADGTLPGEAPQLPQSTWGFDVIGHIEASGEFLATLEHNRDLARGLLDPGQGDLEPDVLDHERFFEDALAFARSGAERRYEQDQGFAPLVLQPGFEQDDEGKWHLNADAFAAAAQQQRSLGTDIDMPELVQRRRHWRDQGPDEQRALSYGFEAESHGLVDPDALAGHVNESLPRQDGLDGVTVEELEDLLGEQGAADYLAHLYEMVFHQLERIEREREHARQVASAHPVALSTNGRYGIYLRSTKRSEDAWPVVTRPWRERNAARRALRERRAGAQERCSYRPCLPPVAEATQRKVQRRVSLQVIPAGSLRTHDDTPDGSVVQERTTEDLVVRVRGVEFTPGRPVELPTDPAWWDAHGHRIHGLLAQWGFEIPVIWPHQLVRGFQIDEAWLSAAEDAYYVLRCG